MMINSLRKKFIIFTMLVLSTLFFIIVATINIVNYISINNNADSILDILEDNNGIIPDRKPEPNIKPSDKNNPSLDGELSFRSRYFTVTIIDDEVTSINLDRIAMIDEETAKNITNELYQNNKQNGFYNNYKYRFVNYLDSSMYIFLDCNMELQNFNSFLIASIWISLGGLAVIFIIVFITSTIATKPIAESYRKQKEFITNINHEIKTPLSIIKATNEIIEMNDGKNEWTEIIDGQINKLTELTEKLIFLSKMNEDTQKINNQEFNLTQISYEVIEPFIILAKSKNKELIINIEDNMKYYGDVSLIGQLISILLDNAIKYSIDNTAINLEIYSQGKNKKIKITNVSDNIKPGKLDYLFERFYKDDNTSNGQGIGLSIAKAIVLAHKGKIQAYSYEINKITFLITL